MPDEKKGSEPQQVNLIGSPDKFTPKFCNSVNFSVLQNGLVNITLTYNEPNNPPVLIERVTIDLNHAKEVSRVLNEVLAKIEKGKEENVSKRKSK